MSGLEAGPCLSEGEAASDRSVSLALNLPQDHGGQGGGSDFAKRSSRQKLGLRGVPPVARLGPAGEAQGPCREGLPTQTHRHTPPAPEKPLLGTEAFPAWTRGSKSRASSLVLPNSCSCAHPRHRLRLPRQMKLYYHTQTSLLPVGHLGSSEKPACWLGLEANKPGPGERGCGGAWGREAQRDPHPRFP